MEQLNNSFCIFCMEKLEAGVMECPVCGKHIWDYNHKKHWLKPYTLLHDRYLLGAVQGNGGFGITYIAYDTLLETPVAVKEYFPSRYLNRDVSNRDQVQLKDEEFREAWEKGLSSYVEEARMLVRFAELPGVVSVRDFFHENETAYMVSEFIQGGTVKDALKNSGKTMAISEILEKLRPVLESLAQIHNSGIIHRDISADNLMITKEGNWKLIDFGAAWNGLNSGDLEAVLKTGYAPPEQYNPSASLGPWTDIYALCSVIYSLLTGVMPPASLERCMKDTLRPISYYHSIDEKTERAIMDGLALNPAHRYFYLGQLMMRLYPDFSPKKLSILAGEARKCWGENWITVSADMGEESYSSKKRHRFTRKLIQRTAICTGILVILGGVTYAGYAWFCHTFPEKVLEYRLNADREAYYDVKLSEAVFENGSEEQQEFLEFLNGNAEDIKDYDNYTSYAVSVDEMKQQGVFDGKSGFFVRYDTLKPYLDFVYEGEKKLNLNTVSTDGQERVSFSYYPEEKRMYANTTLSQTWNIGRSADGFGCIEIYYEGIYGNVRKLSLDTNEKEEMKDFVRHFLPVLIPDTYWTEEELTEFFEQDSEDESYVYANGGSYSVSLSRRDDSFSEYKYSLDINPGAEYLEYAGEKMRAGYSMEVGL